MPTINGTPASDMRQLYALTGAGRFSGSEREFECRAPRETLGGDTLMGPPGRPHRSAAKKFGLGLV